MRVLVVGASGAIGTRLVPQSIGRGHEVVGTSTSARGARRVRALGARPVVLDLLDPPAVHDAVRTAAPDAIVHEATALAAVRFSRHLDRAFAATNRLRTAGTDAAPGGGARGGGGPRRGPELRQQPLRPGRADR